MSERLSWLCSCLICSKTMASNTQLMFFIQKMTSVPTVFSTLWWTWSLYILNRLKSMTRENSRHYCGTKFWWLKYVTLVTVAEYVQTTGTIMESWDSLALVPNVSLSRIYYCCILQCGCTAEAKNEASKNFPMPPLDSVYVQEV